MPKREKHRKTDPEKVLRYSGDGLSDEERHAIEHELQKDPFLEEALEGLSTLSPEQAREDLNHLKSRLRKKVARRSIPVWIGAAASIAILAVLGTLYLTVFQDKLQRADQIAVETEQTGDEGKKSNLEDATEKEGIPISRQAEPPVVQPGAETLDKIQTETSGEESGDKQLAQNVREEENQGKQTDEKVSGAKGLPVTEDTEAEIETGMDEDILFTEKGAGTGIDTIHSEFKQEITPDVVNLGEEEKAAEPLPALTRARRSEMTQPTALGENVENKALLEVVTRQQAEEVQGIPDSIPAMPVIGQEAFLKYISQNLRYPADDSLSTGGTVLLRFGIDPGGHPRNIEVLESPGYSFSLEAVRLLREGPAWTPVIRNGVRTDEKTKLSIEFKR